MVFYEKARQVLRNHHSVPFYVTAFVHDVRLRHALVDPGRAFEHRASIHARGDGNPWREIVEQPIEVSGFEGNAPFTLEHISFALTVRPI